MYPTRIFCGEFFLFFNGTSCYLQFDGIVNRGPTLHCKIWKTGHKIFLQCILDIAFDLRVTARTQYAHAHVADRLLYVDHCSTKYRAP